jgi:predicted PurR-regulated permease PerM
MTRSDPEEQSATASQRSGSLGPPAAAALSPFLLLATGGLVIAGLYWLQAVLIPIALAVLLTFMLSPVVGVLERGRFGRVTAVLVVVVLSLVVVSAIGWVLARQLATLADELPRYTANLRQKVKELRGASRGGSVEKVQKTVEDVVSEIQKSAPSTASPPPPPPPPVPAVIEPGSVLAHLPNLLEALASAAVVTVLVIFMLLERRELRDRVIRLIGYRRVTATTRALDEAGARISRYLLMQSLLNGSFGVAVGIGLFGIDVPYAVLWGFLAAALRFIPYVGPWAALLLPLALSLAVFPGWWHPALVVGLFLALELISSFVMEPWLYGQSAGVSQVGLLVAVTFWTWLWGPIGLLLATPLTVCVLVLGRYLPDLSFIVVLMSDEPVVDAKARYYQRLLARDQDEAAEAADTYLEEKPPELVYDDVLLPSLYYAKQDRQRGWLTDEDVQFVVTASRDVLMSLADDLARREEGPEKGPAPADDGTRRALGVPVHDAVDRLALDMLRQMLGPARSRFETLSAAFLSAEVVARVEAQRPAVVCVGSVAPGGLSQSRHLCKRLRARFPDLKIVVGRWGLHDEREAERPQLIAAGADAVELSLLDTQRSLAELMMIPDPPSPGAYRAGTLEIPATVDRGA